MFLADFKGVFAGNDRYFVKKTPLTAGVSSVSVRQAVRKIKIMSEM